VSDLKLVTLLVQQ